MKVSLILGLSVLAVVPIFFMFPEASFETYLEILVILLALPLIAAVLIHSLLDFIG